MSNPNDASTSFNGGLPAVASLQDLINRAAAAGYQNPDLTRFVDQIRQGYESDAGLNLPSLSADTNLLKRAGIDLDDAVARMRTSAANLPGHWGGDAADEFADGLNTHVENAAGYTSTFKQLPPTMDGLNDALLGLTGAKADGVKGVDDAILGVKGRWLSALDNVAKGVGTDEDRQIVSTEIKSFLEGSASPVLNAALKQVPDTERQALDLVINDLKSKSGTRFASPGDQEWTSGQNYGSGQNSSGQYSGGQTSTGAQQSGGGQSSGMDPSQMISGITQPLQSAVSAATQGISSLVSGIVSGVTGALGSIPFDQLGQHDMNPDANAEGVSDSKDGDSKYGTDKDVSHEKPAGGDKPATEAKVSDEAIAREAATDGKAQPIRDGQVTGSGIAEGAVTNTPPPATATGAPGTGMPISPGAFGTPGTQPGSTGQPLGGLPPIAPHQQQQTQQHQSVPPPPAEPAPASPLPSAGPAAPQAHVSAAEAAAKPGEVPCEIAADELPKAGR